MSEIREKQRKFISKSDLLAMIGSIQKDYISENSIKAITDWYSDIYESDDEKYGTWHRVAENGNIKIALGDKHVTLPDEIM